VFIVTGKKNLLPCPFCGNKNSDSWDGVKLRQKEITEAGYGIPLSEPQKRFYVYCGNCGAQGGMGQTGKVANGEVITQKQAMDIAVRKWNQRPDPE